VIRGWIRPGSLQVWLPGLLLAQGSLRTRPHTGSARTGSIAPAGRPEL